jgi:hypothetical protein
MLDILDRYESPTLIGCGTQRTCHRAAISRLRKRDVHYAREIKLQGGIKPDIRPGGVSARFSIPRPLLGLTITHKFGEKGKPPAQAPPAP